MILWVAECLIQFLETVDGPCSDGIICKESQADSDPLPSELSRHIINNGNSISDKEVRRNCTSLLYAATSRDMLGFVDLFPNDTWTASEIP